jgi:hypothetical protein
MADEVCRLPAIWDHRIDRSIGAGLDVELRVADTSIAAGRPVTQMTGAAGFDRNTSKVLSRSRFETVYQNADNTS